MRSQTNRRKYKTFNDLVFENNKAEIYFSEYHIEVLEQQANPKYIVVVSLKGKEDSKFQFSTPENVTSLLRLIQGNVTVETD